MEIKKITLNHQKENFIDKPDAGKPTLRSNKGIKKVQSQINNVSGNSALYFYHVEV